MRSNDNCINLTARFTKRNGNNLPSRFDSVGCPKLLFQLKIYDKFDAENFLVFYFLLEKISDH